MVVRTLSDKYPWNQETFEKAYRVAQYTERTIKNNTTFQKQESKQRKWHC